MLRDKILIIQHESVVNLKWKTSRTISRTTIRTTTRIITRTTIRTSRTISRTSRTISRTTRKIISRITISTTNPVVDLKFSRREFFSTASDYSFNNFSIGDFLTANTTDKQTAIFIMSKTINGTMQTKTAAVNSTSVTTAYQTVPKR